MSEEAPQDLVEALEQRGLLRVGAAHIFEPLTGGVASDIWKVTSDGTTFAVKRALAKLRVSADWHVPVSRNASEVAWMETAGRIVPGIAPRVIAHNADAGFFAMEYLDPRQHRLWKTELREGRANPEFAHRVGDALGAIHAATAGLVDPVLFNDTDVFHAIRLEPYLEATAHKHTDIAHRLVELVETTRKNRFTLIHGDVSPKNILCGPNGPVFLDAECAWVGDPAFDVAFCLNHMLLKCVWTPSAIVKFLACFDALSSAYLTHVTWEPQGAIEKRIAGLLPALLLARIDGKSPVEYITEETQRQLVRDFAIPLIASPVGNLADIRARWNTTLIETRIK
jgi:aminoglycoside phosphotransferase (APT) family kinase protein